MITVDNDYELDQLATLLLAKYNKCKPPCGSSSLGAFDLYTQNTASVTLLGKGIQTNPLRANTNISAQAGNQLSIVADGLFVPLPTGGGGGGSSQQNGIVYGGIVTWTGIGYIYDITAAGYWINSVFYESPAITVTLDPADAAYNRIDTFIVDTSSIASVLTGIPSDNPAEFPINLSTQIRLSIAVVEVGAVTPSIDQCIYQENVEWTTSSSSVRINANSTSLPCSGTKSVEGTNVLNGDNILFTNPAGAFTPKSYNFISLNLRSKGAWEDAQLYLQWELAGVPVGNSVIIANTSYGFDELNVLLCQSIIIGLNDFVGLTFADQADSLRITAIVPDSFTGFRLDSFCLNTEEIIPGNTVSLIYNNGLTRTGNTVQFGGELLHNTVLDTQYNIMNFNGHAIYDYNYKFYKSIDWQAGADIVSFRSKGGAVNTEPDWNNAVQLGIHYTGRLYPASIPPDLSGYMNDKIGYWIGVNTIGNGSFGLRVDNANSKIGGMFFHTFDTSYTDVLTFFGKHPPNPVYQGTINGAGGLESYRILTLHDNKNVTLYGYPDSRNDGGTVSALYVDVDGHVKHGPISGLGGSPIIQSILSGNGITTSFTIPHGFVGTPSIVLTAGSENASGISYYNIDATNITIFYDVAPASGTNNLTYYWTSAAGGVGGGTLTAVSIASSNGFAGSSSGGDTPVLTLSTTITGILKGNGTAISTAVAGDFPTLNQSTTGNAATVTTNANLTGPVTSTGNATAIANGAISNAMLANAAVANLSGTNTGDNATNTQYSGLVSNATHTGDATGATALTLATVNANVGTFGSATAIPSFTVDGKGRITAASNNTGTGFIWNQIVSPQTANFHIDGYSGIGVNAAVNYKLYVTDTNVATDSHKNTIRAEMAGTFDTTDGALEATAIVGISSGTRSAGAFNLMNRGLFVSASGAQVNIAAQFSTGEIVMQDLANLTTQNRIIGHDSASQRIGYITVSTGLDLTAGVLTATGGGGGTVTSVGFTGGLISVATATTTPAFTVAGTSGGIPYFSSASTWASSGALTAAAIILGGGAGASPTSLVLGTANQVIGMNNAGTANEYKTISIGTTAQSNDIGWVLSGANAAVLHIPDASSTVRGVVTTGAQTFAGVKTLSSAPVFSAGFQTNSVASNANLAVLSGNGGTNTSTSAGLTFESSTTVEMRVSSNGSGSMTPTAGRSAANWIFGVSNVITEAATGTHALFANVVIKALNTGDGAGATTNTATLYIEGAPTGTVVPTNGAWTQWNKAGISRFGGGILLDAGSTTIYPIKYTSGPFLTTPQVGVVEFLTNAWYGTITTGAARKEFLFADGSAASLTSFPTLNQNTTGSAATLTTSRNINGVAFNGSADITVTAAAGTLTGTTLNSSVVTSSLTAHGTITTGGLGTGAVIGGVTMTLGSDAANDIYYRNGSGILTRLANGTTGQFLAATTASAPSWSTPAGSGNVSKVGTPVDNQIGVWTGDGTIEGSTQLTFTGQALQLASTNTTQVTTAAILAIAANSLTTGTAQYIASSTITTGNLLSLVTTGTAAAAGNEALNIDRSGANGTSSITVTGARITLANTGTTSTNVGLDIAVSGASTNTAITANSDVEITDTTKGVILKSPDSTRWRLTIADTGIITATSL